MTLRENRGSRVLSLFRAEDATAHLNSSHEAQRRTAFDPQQSKNRKDKKPKQASEKIHPDPSDHSQRVCACLRFAAVHLAAD